MFSTKFFYNLSSYQLFIHPILSYLVKKFQTIAIYLFPTLYLKSKYIKEDAEFI